MDNTSLIIYGYIIMGLLACILALWGVVYLVGPHKGKIK